MMYMLRMKLEQLREERDLTKRCLAETLGVSASVYSRQENGKDFIPTRRVYQLANYYQVNIDYLLGLTSTRIKIISKKEICIPLVSSRMIIIRKDCNETLREFVKHFNTSNSTWSAYETGKTLILGAFLIEICKSMNYSADWILGRTDIKYRE